MNYYILDDDINIIKILQNVIEENFKRVVVGYNTDPVDAVAEIMTLKPDIVIIDYLMPVLDGSDVIKKIQNLDSNIKFVMISQISDKAMIQDAYSNGLSFFINKPINKIEVNVVLSNIEANLETEAKLNQIFNVFGNGNISGSNKESNSMDNIRKILRDLGIYSEKGSKDILAVCEILFRTPKTTTHDAILMMCEKSESCKVIRQRIRRAIAKGLRNIAFIGIEDNMSERFIKYSNSLYDFETVKLEMDYVRGKTKNKGTLLIDRFIENLIDFEM